MFTRTRIAAALAATGLALTLGAGTAQAAGQTIAATSHGCPDGYVCMYPSAGWNNDVPQAKWYTYGAHNLSNVLGTHRLFNNQTGGAIARTCTGYNGTGCEGALGAGWYIDKNMTPINSVLLATS
ncbi:hypothetical protein [Kineosporia succinea]|uniref:Peptidase inhibitor family I36 n=1 Tax=Kineosporia succinea TaxID=84632 RepID=A0ABT9P7V7_9ACTN|nr:hypothetical protein [Kineosporia succinea]MDP9828631.1 hypothetical protein [Kineosporia succinea]